MFNGITRRTSGAALSTILSFSQRQAIFSDQDTSASAKNTQYKSIFFHEHLSPSSDIQNPVFCKKLGDLTKPPATSAQNFLKALTAIFQQGATEVDTCAYPEFKDGANPMRASQLGELVENILGQPVLNSTRGNPSKPIDLLTLTEMVRGFALKVIDHQYEGYTSPGGSPEERAVIAELLNKKLGLSNEAYLSKDNVFFTCGGAEAGKIVFSYLANAGYTLHFPSPTYSMYSSQVKTYAPNAEVKHHPVQRGDFTPEFLESLRSVVQKNPQQKHAFILTLPGNPVGGMPTAEVLESLAELHRENSNLTYVVDLAYADNVQNGQFMEQVYQALGPDCMYIFSASKGLGMPGSRAGMMLGPASDIRHISHNEGGMSTLNAHPFVAPALKAALSLSSDELEAITHHYIKKRMLPIYSAMKMLDVIPPNEPVHPMFLYLDATLVKEKIPFGTPMPEEAREALRQLGVAEPHTTLKNDLDLAAYLAVMYGMIAVPVSECLEDGSYAYGLRFFGAYPDINDCYYLISLIELLIRS